MTKSSNPIENAISAMLQTTIRQGLIKGAQPSPGVVVLHRDAVRDILEATFPHLKPGADPSQDSANLTLSYSNEGLPIITHVNLKTGETTVTKFEAETAVAFGTMMIQFGALSRAGVRPPPEPTNDGPVSPQ